MVAMLAVLAWLGAHIFWTLSAEESPAPPMALETEPRRAAQTVVARHPFGEVASGPVVVTAIDIRLTGVIAAQRQGEAGMAFLVLEGKTPMAVREGAEVAPGIVLHRVLPRQVELARGAQIQILTLPEPRQSHGR